MRVAKFEPVAWKEVLTKTGPRSDERTEKTSEAVKWCTNQRTTRRAKHPGRWSERESVDADTPRECSYAAQYVSARVSIFRCGDVFRVASDGGRSVRALTGTTLVRVGAGIAGVG